MYRDRRVRPRPRLGIIAAMMLTMALVPGIASASTEPAHTTDAETVDPDTVLVRMDAGPLTRLLRSSSEWTAVEVAEGETPEEALERLEDDPSVAEVSLNYRYEQLDAYPPNDPFYPLQWHLPDVGLLGAWEHTKGADATIAIIDGGVSSGGTDLLDATGLKCRTAFVDPYNGATNTAGAAEPNANDPHGTHVAGTATQCSDNLIGTAGMAPDADVMPIRVANASGVILTSYVDRGIRWAVDHGADVINISLGLSGGCFAHWPICGDPVMNAAISYATSAGVPIVAASGNNSNSVYVGYPANHPETIAVGASTSAREVADYSDGGLALDLVAPGGESLESGGDPVVQEAFDRATGDWGIFGGSGTSSAAPHVSGAVALLRSLEPSLSPDEVLDVLTDTALDIEVPGRDDASGAGLLQADAAIDALIAPAESDTSIIGGTAVVSNAVASQIVNITGSQPTRLWGPDRFSTASEVSGASSEPVEPVVYIATGRNFPDALAAGPVAALQDAPILLVNATSIPSATRTELTRLEPYRIVILGGPAAVSSSVEAALAPYATLPVERISGANRYTTAVAISESFFTNPHRVDTVYLATGLNFPDALSAGPAAALANGPILLTSRTSLPGAVAQELLRLDPERVVIVGGAIAVSSAVQDAVESLGFDVDRFNGATRYHTSALVVADAFQDTPVPTFVATGANFPDALAASAAIGSRDGALLLTTLNSLPNVVAAELDRLSS